MNYSPIIVKNKMKVLITAVLLVSIIGNIGAVDIDSRPFIDYIRSKSRPGSPELFENGVVFTAASSHQRVGISFAHEGYARVHWYRQLLIPRDAAELYVDGKRQHDIEPNIDSGIMFYVIEIPENLQNLDYRLIINGLWTVDPLNPLTVKSPSGISSSRFILPAPLPGDIRPLPGSYRFSLNASPGEIITVGGDFNNWDPFMYELRETSPGTYSLTLPMPRGSFQYMFFYRGEMIADPSNPRRLFNREGRYVSEGVVN